MKNSEFDDWFNQLLLAAASSNKYGMEHPIGSCLMRDIFRECKPYLKEAWEKIVEEKTATKESVGEAAHKYAEIEGSIVGDFYPFIKTKMVNSFIAGANWRYHQMTDGESI